MGVLRIEITRDSAREIRLSLAGRLSGDHIPELGQLLEQARSTGRRFLLDLKAVTLADRDAVTFLACGAGTEATLESCPPFLREWIDREAERYQSVPGECTTLA